MTAPVIQIKRAYAAPTRDDGYRVLVDRVWPRGKSKRQLRLDAWCKELAPSTELRRWFGHDPQRWQEFQRRYRAELRDKNALLDELLAHDRLTLVYAARDEQHNQAVVLRARLLERRRARRRHVDR